MTLALILILGAVVLIAYARDTRNMKRETERLKLPPSLLAGSTWGRRR